MNAGNLKLFFIGNHSYEGDYIPQAHGEGIVSCILNIETGEIKKLDFNKDEPNSTYLAKSKTDNYLFAAGDRYFSPGQISAFEIGSDGYLTLLSSVEVPGQATCHVACHPDGERVYVSSYLDGLLTIHRFNERTISPPLKVIAYEGSGPNKERQESAHAHQSVISPDAKWLYVCDLGSDRIWVHKPDETDELEIIHEAAIPPGYGPRHLVCHPVLPLIYVLCELNGHVLTLQRDEASGSLKLIDDLPTLPPDYTGKPSAAAIKLHTSGKALVVSNREHHSVTFFSTDKENGHLNRETVISTEGRDPRDFGIDPTGNWLLAANQNSNTIIPFKLNPDTGLPTGGKGRIFHTGTPVCVVFN